MFSTRKMASRVSPPHPRAPVPNPDDDVAFAPDHHEKYRKHEERLLGWVLQKLDPEHQKMIMEFLKISKRAVNEGLEATPMDEMMTPYPISRVIAVRTYQILYSMNMVDIRNPMSTITFLDLMAGTGVDGFAMKQILGRHVNVIASDIDPVRAQFMKQLLIEHTSNPNEDCKGKDSEERALKSVQVQVADAEKAILSNVDVLYLDPPWPLDQAKDYKIGETELSEFVDKHLSMVPTLRMVIIKVSSKWSKSSLKQKLRELCDKQRMCLEVFFPIGGHASIKSQRTRNMIGPAEPIANLSSHYRPPGSGLPMPQPWDIDWNRTMTTTEDMPGGVAAYSGEVRILYITRKEQQPTSGSIDESFADDVLWTLNGLLTVNQSEQQQYASPSSSDLPANFRSLDISCFM